MVAEFDMTTGEWLRNDGPSLSVSTATPVATVGLRLVEAPVSYSRDYRLPPELADVPVDAFLAKF